MRQIYTEYSVKRARPTMLYTTLLLLLFLGILSGVVSVSILGLVAAYAVICLVLKSTLKKLSEP